MATGSRIADRLIDLLPGWLSWPLSAAAAVVGFAGAGLILWSASTGSITAAIWSGACFVAAAGLWYLSEFAGIDA